MKFAALFSLLALCAANAARAGDQCREPEQAARFAETLNFEAAGKGRLHFHSGPHDDCRIAKLFVIPGDALVANLVGGENDGWVQVTYTDKDERSHTGWVRAERLRFMSASGMNMTPDKFKRLQEGRRGRRCRQAGPAVTA